MWKKHNPKKPNITTESMSSTLSELLGMEEGMKQRRNRRPGSTRVLPPGRYPRPPRRRPAGRARPRREPAFPKMTMRICPRLDVPQSSHRMPLSFPLDAPGSTPNAGWEGNVRAVKWRSEEGTVRDGCKGKNKTQAPECLPHLQKTYSCCLANGGRRLTIVCTIIWNS